MASNGSGGCRFSDSDGTLRFKHRTFYDARAIGRAGELGRFYHRLLRDYFSYLTPPGARVLEIGCGLGDLLASVRPARGVGVDFSPRMIDLARQRHPALEFHVAEALE